MSEPGFNRPYLRFRYAVNAETLSYISVGLHISDTENLSESMAIIYSYSNDYFQNGNAACHKVKVVSNWFHYQLPNISFPIT